MGVRKIATIENQATGLRAVVQYNSDFAEFVVKFYRDGEELLESRYFTNDKGDAIGTARASVGLPPLLLTQG